MIKTTIQNNNNEILNRLDRIEDLLLHIFKREEELTEDDVLEIIKEGEDEYRRGKTIEFDELVRTQFPHLVKIGGHRIYQ